MHRLTGDRFEKYCVRLGALALMLLLGACTADSATHKANGSRLALPRPDAALLLPDDTTAEALPDLDRMVTALDVSIQPALSGAQFDSQLISSRVEADAGGALFTPAFAASADSLADAAYCIYRLRCFQQADSAMLELFWADPPTQNSDCWIGVSSWPDARWQWLQMPEAGQIALEPASFANEFHYGLVAVVMLGEESAELGRLELSFDPDATEQFTLFSPLTDERTFLLNMDKEIVHTWHSTHAPGFAVYLLDNQNLLRATFTNTNELVSSGNAGGIELLDFAGNLLWSVDLGSAGIYTHHDIEPMPNGNILVPALEAMSSEEAIAIGRDPAKLGASGLWTECVYEIRPIGTDSFEVVWEWHMQDHLIQDFDETKANFGVVSEHAELLDINYEATANPDWMHVNSVDYNALRDEIAISVSGSSEIFIIDHSTTSAEAASHSGGRHGRGGDLLFRWGNTRAYQIGLPSDQKLFRQHDANWIPQGCPGAGNILVFSNRERSPQNVNFSSVIEITPEFNPDDSYKFVANRYLPNNPTWKYIADPPQGLLSSILSGAQRLPNGNTFITDGDSAELTEVTPAMETVWEYEWDDPESGLPQIFRALRYELFTPWFVFNGDGLQL